MGGLAFAQPGPNGESPLLTPRMPPKVYHSLSITCLNVIKDHYRIVEQLADAPEKKDFGDIDFLVQDPITPDANEHIARKLKAERTLVNSLDLTLAIPCDSEDFSPVTQSPASEPPPCDHSTPEDNIHPSLLNEATNKVELGATPSSAQSKIYAQVDIRQYPPDIPLNWVKFCHSYGDLGQILGYLSYELGITSNDKGFHVRIVEQESWNRKASMIFLSDDPAVVTRFLGLDWKLYCAGFKTEGELLDWVSKSKTAKRYPPRLSDSDGVENSDDGKKSVGVEKNDCVEKINGIREADAETRKESADHRRRILTRPLFARFVTKILPTLPLLDIEITTARQNILQEALVFFDKQQEYDDRILQVRARNEEEAARLLMMAELTDVLELKKEKAREIVRAVKRWGSFVHGKLCIRDAAAMNPSDEFQLAILLDANRYSLSQEARSWIRENMSVVKELERARAKRAKAEKAKVAALAAVTPREVSEMLDKMSVADEKAKE